MLHVMIVDDKKSILEGMKMLIDWGKYGFEITNTATNGTAAVEILRNQRIDLCITDMRMPQMTGLELIALGREISPHTQFIILSGYDEFEYAKRALEYQVCGYLLKPIDEDELIALLGKVKTNIKQHHDYSNHVFWKKVQNTFTGEYDDFETDLSNSELCCVSLNAKEEKAISGQMHYRENEKFKQFVIDFEKEFPTGSYDYIEKNINERVLILNLKEIENTFDNILNNIKGMLELYAPEKFVVFVGKRVCKISESVISKNSIEVLKNIMFYEFNRRFFVYDKEEDVTFSEEISDNDMFSGCVAAIKSGSDEDIKLAVYKAFDKAAHDRVNVQKLYMHIYNIIFNICNTVIENGGDVTKVLYKWSIIKKIPLPELVMFRDCFTELAIDLRDKLQELKSLNMFGNIGIIVNYINENYNNENLNLQWLSEQYHITSSYLGKLLKKKLGVSFNKYLTSVRINKAKELLSKSDYKVYEIAHMVGYNDPNYFHVKFIETENLTPAKYRELNFGKKI